jgi:hypothetical protein
MSSDYPVTDLLYDTYSYEPRASMRILYTKASTVAVQLLDCADLMAHLRTDDFFGYVSINEGTLLIGVMV